MKYYNKNNIKKNKNEDLSNLSDSEKIELYKIKQSNSTKKVFMLGCLPLIIILIIMFGMFAFFFINVLISLKTQGVY